MSAGASAIARQREQHDVSEYLREEDRVLKAPLRSQRVRFTDDERRRLAAVGIRSSVYTTRATWNGAALVLTSTVPMAGQGPWRITDVYRIANEQWVIENTTEDFRGKFSGKRVCKSARRAA